MNEMQKLVVELIQELEKCSIEEIQEIKVEWLKEIEARGASKAIQVLANEICRLVIENKSAKEGVAV